jgi:hypothetical protein
MVWWIMRKQVMWGRRPPTHPALLAGAYRAFQDMQEHMSFISCTTHRITKGAEAQRHTKKVRANSMKKNHLMLSSCKASTR